MLLLLRRTRTQLLAVLVAPAILPAQASRLPDSTIAHRADEYLSRLAEQKFSGGAIVIRDGKTIFEKSYGLANRAANIAADTSTVYNLGSITKQFTAATILRLEELGKLRTTDSIKRFFPAAPADKRNITLHQLLTHTAGFESDFSRTDYDSTTRDDYMSRMLASKLRSTPGTTHFYSNSGYSMLAAIVEIVTGKEYEQALTELVLRPAGMQQTGYTAPHWDARRLAHGYQDGRDWGTIVERITGPGKPYWALRGNGGLGTTLGDMARWDAALKDARMLTDSSRRKFMTGYVNEGPLGLSQYAYGWAVMKTRRNTRLVTHNGGNGIFVAELLRFVDEGTTLFVASTNADKMATPVVRVLEHIVFNEPYELPPKAGKVAAALLASFAGVYSLGTADSIVIHADNDALTADGIGQRAFALLRNGDTASSPRSAALNEKVKRIVEGLSKGDATLLVAALDGGRPLAEIQAQENQMLANRKQRFGEFKSVEVLGTIAGEMGPATVARFNFSRGGATNIYEWTRDDRIADIRAQPYQPASLLPLSDTAFAIPQTSGTSTTVSLRGRNLIAHAKSGDILLVRRP